MDKPKFSVGQTVFCDIRSFSASYFNKDYLIKAYNKEWNHAKIVRIFHVKEECQEILPDGTVKSDGFLIPDGLPEPHEEYQYELDTTISWADETDYGDSSRIFEEEYLMSREELKEAVEELSRKINFELKIAEIDSRLTFLERQIFNLSETKKLCPNLSADINEKIASMNVEVATLRENRAKLIAG